MVAAKLENYMLSNCDTNLVNRMTCGGWKQRDTKAM